MQESFYPLSTPHSDIPENHNLQTRQCERLESHTLQCLVTVTKKEQILTEKRGNNVNLAKLTMGRSGLSMVTEVKFQTP
jgi:hypothetical protein